MEMKIIIVGENEYRFANETWSKSNSWGHRTSLLKNGTHISTNSCRYYNRTWERYTYQTVMQGCVSQIIDGELQDFIADFKSSNEISRFKKGQREEVTKQFYEEESIKELQKLKSQLS